MKHSAVYLQGIVAAEARKAETHWRGSSVAIGRQGSRGNQLRAHARCRSAGGTRATLTVPNRPLPSVRRCPVFSSSSHVRSPGDSRNIDTGTAGSSGESLSMLCMELSVVVERTRASPEEGDGVLLPEEVLWKKAASREDGLEPVELALWSGSSAPCKPVVCLRSCPLGKATLP